MKESAYKLQLTKKLEKMFPGCVILKNDPNHTQGLPDLTVLYKDRWFALEVKRSESANVQPNQEYYVKKLDDMSYAAFISPANEEQVLDEIKELLSHSRSV